MVHINHSKFIQVTSKNQSWQRSWRNARLKKRSLRNDMDTWTGISTATERWCMEGRGWGFMRSKETLWPCLVLCYNCL